MENRPETIAARQEKALALVEAIIKLDPDISTLQYARKMREKLRLPMSKVLVNVYPDLSVIEKAEKLGVTRQAYYGWLNGISRPNIKVSRKLAALTGYDWRDIRGKLR